MARITRTRRGLNDAPDLLALIDRARAVSARPEPALDCAVLSRAADVGADLSGLAPASPTLFGPPPSSPAWPDAARPDPAPFGPTGSGPSSSGPPPSGTTPFGTAQSGPTAAGADGHRSRMRARLLAAGPESLADHEMLEMVLFLALPRRDTKPLARLLLTRFGSFAGAIAAPVTELSTLDGLGDAGVAALKLVQAAALRLALSEVINRPVLANWDRLMAYLTASLSRERVEQFRVLFLDTRNRLLADEAQGRGTVNHTPVYPREVVKRALELHATALILVHNHPSGDPTPSAADIDMTREIGTAAAALSIALHDHVIIGNERWLSFRREGLL